jgi:predicted RNase H-like nuclease
MSMTRSQRGPQLPYKTLAGVVPCSRGWLAASAKLQGITLSPEDPQVFTSLLDLLDYKPAFQVIALFSPIGLLDEPSPGGRHCDRDARRLLGWPRSGAIVSPPVRRAVNCTSYEEAAAANGGHMSIVTWQLLKKVAEVDANIAPYWQRTVFEVHPELTFYQLNDDHPVRYSKHKVAGAEERRNLLRVKLHGVGRIFDAKLPKISQAQLIDAAACLWAARRIVSRAVNRLPEDPEWDGMGLRMEVVR